ncbi:MAG: hypothetical protein CMJ62_02730 [Planctomycetaceae bacterium]|nr:hypothetical protein [Planctomycetaceae bacterium]
MKCFFFAVFSLLVSTLPVVAEESIPLRAGPLSMTFDVDNVMLRFVRVGKAEVLRGINAPVRNQFWGTVPPRASDIRLQESDGAFQLTFDVKCQERDIDFFWKGRIVGNSEGHVVFTFDGEAHSTFLRNRLGFCILHGPSAAGQSWRIEDIQGNETPGHFPKFIAPDQPAKNIRAISHEIAPGVWAQVRCEGDTFEMEDQRNWTDASFKTYCTPLEIPYPVKVVKGTRISHKVQISLRGDLSQLLRDNQPTDEVTLSLVEGGQALHTLPGIGLQLSSQVDQLEAAQTTRLKALNMDHLRVTLTPASDSFASVLEQATTQASALGVSLHVGIQIGEKPAPELQRLADAIKITQPPVSAWLVLAADQKKFQLARRILGPVVPVSRIGTGEDTNFTELNRNRAVDSHVQMISYGMNPQCHAIDTLTMVENLEIQADTVHSARQFVGDRPLLISPITLRVQGVRQAPLAGELPSNVDARQPSVFTAGWTLGSIKYLAQAGADSLTYYETVGWKGVMSPAGDFPLPDIFPAKPDEVYAVYHVFRAVGEFAGGKVREVRSSDGLSAIGLALAKKGRTRLLVANLSERAQSIRILGLAPGDVELFRLDADNETTARSDPEAFSRRRGQWLSVSRKPLQLHLAPYGIAQLDQGS